MSYCRQCGHELADHDAFCGSCGAPSSGQPAATQASGAQPMGAEPVAWTSLRQLLAEVGALAPEQAFGVLDSAVAALAVLHASGLVHGDVRPETILVDPSSGATQLTGVTAPAAGSPGYRAPETPTGGRPDERNDLYAMGAVLFEVLSGRPPVGVDHPGPVASRHPHAAAAVLPGAAPEVADLCRRILAQDPAGRPATADELRVELEAVACSAFGPDWRTRSSMAGLAAAIGDGGRRTQAVRTAGVSPVAFPAPVAPVAPAGRPPRRQRSGVLGGHNLLLAAASVLVIAAAAAGVGIAHVAASSPARTVAAPHRVHAPRTATSRPAPAKTVTTAPVTTAPVTTTTLPPTPSTSAPTTTTVPVATPTALPVVVCPTTGPASSFGTQAPPSTGSATVTPAQANQLELYADPLGVLLVLAPRGWTCDAQGDGALGYVRLIIVPPGTANPANEGDGGLGSSTVPPSDEAINAMETGGGPSADYYTVCPFSASAVEGEVPGSQACTTPPSAEAVDWIQGSSTSLSSTDIVGFEDPAGVAGNGSPSGGPYPANGVVIFGQLPATLYSPAKETCTLPSSEHALCTAVLNDFIGRYGNS